MKDFVITVILLLTLGWIVYLGFKFFAKGPNLITKQTAQAIVQYPNREDWQAQDQKNICLFSTDECLQASKITFHSEDTWTKIYFFYKEAMVKNGWQTKSTVFTSTPTSATFTNSNNCKAELTQSKMLIKFDATSPGNKYFFKITCPDKSVN
mgnify:CR=1 FL=1